MCNTVPKCGLKATIQEGKIIHVEIQRKISELSSLRERVATIQELYDPERLLHPVMRTNPKGSEDPGWKPITWDEAYETIAEKFNEIKARDGAEKVMFYTGDPKEARPIIQRLAYTFGSPSYGIESSTCCHGATDCRQVSGRQAYHRYRSGCKDKKLSDLVQ
jgi:anaerobic selenocysteine-containing dehydrogenase